MKICKFAALVYFYALAGCAHVAGTGGQPPRQPTAIEQVLTWNAALAQSNLTIVRGVIAANEAGEIDVSTSNRILTAQSKIADADRQLTPILAKACNTPPAQPGATAQMTCNAALLSGDAQRIGDFLDTIKASAASIVKDGTAGIKNAEKKQTVQAAIEAIYSLADQMITGLKQLGVLK